jgi:hypothetical protein
MSNYKVNTEKKIITIDDAVKANVADKEDIALYVSAGYVIKHKSKKRAKAAANRANGLKDADILAALKGNQEATDKYKELKHEKGYFTARKFYLDNYAK